MGWWSSMGTAGLGFPRCPGVCSTQDGKPRVPKQWRHPSPVFLREAVAASPALRRISRRARLLSLFSIFQCQQQRSKISPKACLIAKLKKKIMLFQGEKKKGAFSTPSVSSAILYLLIRSHSNPNKHIHHGKKCHSSERSPKACTSPQMFPSPIKPGADNRTPAEGVRRGDATVPPGAEGSHQEP